uniref:Uncharacterized protein n=1 Tax=Sipha flava TaxID=143950 RepID=A0A2S2QJV8_9HEMI
MINFSRFVEIKIDILLVYVFLLLYHFVLYHYAYFIISYYYYPVSTPTITVGLQHLTEIRKVLSSVKNSEEMLGCLNKIENFLAQTHCQHRKQTKIYQFF